MHKVCRVPSDAERTTYIIGTGAGLTSGTRNCGSTHGVWLCAAGRD